MPLAKSSSPAAFKSNLKAELSAGKAREQALAIAYRIQRESRKYGGGLSGFRFADGGDVITDPLDPRNDVASMPTSNPIASGIGQTLVDWQSRPDDMATLGQRAIDVAKRTGAFGAMSPEDEATMNQVAGLGAGLSGTIKNVGAGPIRAYHGSPHDFDAFSMDKIGTGEGAQAYGHGLYFAGNEGVAKSYRDALAGSTVDGRPFNPDNPLHQASARIDEHGTRAAAIDEIEKRIAADPGDDMNPRILSMLLHRPEIPSISPASGKMYEVNINADPEHFLDWDKPLSEQHPSTQEAVKKAMGVDYYGNHDPAKAESLWKQFGNAQAGTAVRQGFIASDDKLVADRLNQSGIPGIKYLDQGSRGAGEGSRNYVVFNDQLIDILKKYALAGIAPPAGLAAALQANQNQDQHFAKGGSPQMPAGLSSAPMPMQSQAPKGLIASPVAGRTDRLPMNVAPNSYVIPADVVSGLGQGNTMAGGRILDAMFGLPGPSSAPTNGAQPPANGHVPIITAGGEWIASPDIVARIGGGDPKAGHKILDNMVTKIRSQVIQQMKSLPGPKK